MLNETLLWTRMIDPVNHRVVKRDTFLGATVKLIGSIALGCATVYLTFAFIVPAVQYFFK